MTEAYAVTLPVGDTTSTSKRPSVSVMPLSARRLRCWCSPGMSEIGIGATTSTPALLKM